ncbi:MAG: IPT/TIG domain-containing protein [Niabella sp.]
MIVQSSVHAICRSFYCLMVIVALLTACTQKDKDILASDQPEITSVLPQTGWSGDTVVIKGTGFTDQSVVLLNGSEFSFLDYADGQFRLIMPVGSGIFNIRVVNGSARSNNMIFTYSGPLISALSDTTGWAGDTLTLTAKGITDTTYLLYNGATIDILDKEGDTIRFIVPEGSGTATITIANGDMVSNDVQFTYNTYTNPVFTPILADPTVFKDPVSGNFYAYGTENYWSTDGKTHIVAIVKSTDMVHWEYVADARSLPSLPGEQERTSGRRILPM